MIHEEYATNITKEELAELPLEEFEGRIFVVLTEKEADKAVDYLMKFKTLGFDTETRPNFKKGQRNKVALMQISTDDTCFLFRLNRIGIPDSLEKLLSSEEVKKIGLSLRDDFGALRKKENLEGTTADQLGSGCSDRCTTEIRGARCLGLPPNIQSPE